MESSCSKICAVTNEARANTDESSKIRGVTSATVTKESSSEIRAATMNTTATTESDGSPTGEAHALRDPFASPQRVPKHYVRLVPPSASGVGFLLVLVASMETAPLVSHPSKRRSWI
jgi:hypothetical protein